MSFIKIANMGSAREREAVPEGEYNLIIISAEPTVVGKDELPIIKVLYEVEGESRAKIVGDTLWLPRASDPEARQEDAVFALQNWCNTFGIPTTEEGIDLDGVKGLVGKAFLKETEDEKYGRQNAVSRYLIA